MAYHGLNFCHGTVAEMLDDPAREIFDVIRWFGDRGKIFNVHFRNIKGRKLDWLTVLEYLALLAEKVSGEYLPSKFLLFGAVGASRMVVHLVVLRLLLAVAGTGFVGAQSAATVTAMVWNYFLNNSLTYRE